jgi:integrase
MNATPVDSPSACPDARERIHRRVPAIAMTPPAIPAGALMTARKSRRLAPAATWERLTPHGSLETRMAEHPLTFAAFYTTWLDEMSPQWRRLHKQGVEDIFAAHLLSVLGPKLITGIDRAQVLALRADLARKPGTRGRRMSNSRIIKIMAVLSQMMAEASQRLHIANPCDNIRRLRPARPDIQPFSLCEVELICDEIRTDFRDYVSARFFTGMRTGEINGLAWRNVDLGMGLIRVRAIYSAGEHEEGGKTAGAVRDIEMIPQVREIFERLALERSPDSCWVFHSCRGNPIDAKNFANRIWYPLLKKIGLEKRRPYQTRHTAATLFLAAGENPEWIARTLGHTNTQMLFTVYSKYVPNLTRNDGTAIASLLRNRRRHQPDQPAC